MKSRIIGKRTDIEKLKLLALQFLDLEPERNEQIPWIVHHPFFETSTIPTVTISENGEKVYGFTDMFDEPEEFGKAKKRIRADIIKGDINNIFCRIVKAYRLSFLKYAKEYMNKDEFEKELIEQWIMSENPNQDNNVSIDEFVEWFSEADRNNLMKDKELKYYNALPDIVSVYRGVAVGRAEQEGLSWTCNYKTALWFANRFNHNDKKGYIIKGKIRKQDIFAYLNSRGEDEILCNSAKVYDIERIEIE